MGSSRKQCRTRKGWSATGPLLLSLSVSIAACTPAAQPAPPTLVRPQTQPLEQPPANAALPAKPRENKCFPKPPAQRVLAAQRSLDAPQAERHGSNCLTRQANVESKLAGELRRAFKPNNKKSRVDVSFGCDPVAELPDTIAVQFASGHGGTLWIWELRRRDAAYAVIGVSLGAVGGRTVIDKAKSSVRDYQVARGEIKLADLSSLLAEARAAAVANISEVAPPNAGLGLSGFGSSRDFYARLEFADGGGRLARSFAGYESSSAQPDYLPLESAFDRLHPLLRAAAPWEWLEAGADQRELFSRRFVASFPEFAREGYWFVTERFAELCSELGDETVVPGLLRLLGRPDKTGGRIHGAALAALAKITGWDARVDASGVSRPPEEAVADYQRECGEVLGNAE